MNIEENSLTFFIVIFVFTLDYMNFFRKFFEKLSINCNMQDILFVISFSLLLILVTFFSIGILKVMYCSVFFPKQVTCFLNSYANYFMTK